MAKTGLLYLAAAPVSAYTEGTSITYSAGSKIGAMISATVDRTISEASLYADNARLEYDNVMTGASVTCELDDLELADCKTLFGWESVTTTDATPVTTYYEPSSLPQKVGLGYIQVKRRTVGGVTSTKYIGNWWYAGRCHIEGEEAKTRGETVEFTTQKMKFSAESVVLRAGGAHDFREMQEFSTESAALTWLKAKAGIT